jgi:hypothetical protein
VSDLRMAQQYVAALAGSPDAPVTAQTIAEAPGATGYPLVMHGVLGDMWGRLCDAQEAGHGVFVVVNETDGKGRRLENIVRVRALFADDDDPDSTIPAFGGAPPSMAVLSGRGIHYYWLLDGCDPLSWFKPAQKGVAAKLKTDPAVSDLARVLRLPGSYHMKSGRPRLVEMVHCDPSARYTIADVLAGLGATPVRPACRRLVAPVPDVSGRRVLGSDARYRAERYLAQIHAVSGNQGDAATYRAAAAVLNNFGLPASTAWEVLRDWNERNAQPPWSEPELAAKFSNAQRYARDAQ